MEKKTLQFYISFVLIDTIQCIIHIFKVILFVFYNPKLLRRVYMLCRFRTANHRLPIETGRRSNTSRAERLCTVCSTSFVDEYHVMFDCKDLNSLRNNLFPRYCYIRFRAIKCRELFQNEHKPNLKICNTQ